MNNQGFTLVEIVITLAIGAIVSIAIGKSFFDYFKSYGQMSTTQIQTMALNGVNEIVNNQVEDAMTVAIQPGNYVLQDGEYGIYANDDGDLMLCDKSGDIMTMFTSQTGSINILNLFVEKDTDLNQLRFKYVYTDGSSEILSRTLTTQLFNADEVKYLGNNYNGDSSTFLLENDNAANILVFTEASLTSNKPEDLTAEQYYAILSYYLGDPSFTPDPVDPQAYFYGMVYWDWDEKKYQVFNNTSVIQYGGKEIDLKDVPSYGSLFDEATYENEKYSDFYNSFKKNGQINLKGGVVVFYDGKYWVRQRAPEGNNRDEQDKSFAGLTGGTYRLLEDLKTTKLSSVEKYHIELKYYDSSASYNAGDIVYKDGALYQVTYHANDDDSISIKFNILNSLYDETKYPNLIVKLDVIANAEIAVFDETLPYYLNKYVIVSYGDTDQKEIYKKVLDNTTVTDPRDTTQRFSGGWQLQSNQYDPYSCYVAGNQVLVFGNQNDEIYVITFKTSNVNDATTRAALNADIAKCYINNQSSVDTTNYSIAKYVFNIR